jgi:hypothetical protein
MVQKRVATQSSNPVHATHPQYSQIPFFECDFQPVWRSKDQDLCITRPRYENNICLRPRGESDSAPVYMRFHKKRFRPSDLFAFHPHCSGSSELPKPTFLPSCLSETTTLASRTTMGPLQILSLTVFCLQSLTSDRLKRRVHRSHPSDNSSIVQLRGNHLQEMVDGTTFWRDRQLSLDVKSPYPLSPSSPWNLSFPLQGHCPGARAQGCSSFDYCDSPIDWPVLIFRLLSESCQLMVITSVCAVWSGKRIQMDEFPFSSDTALACCWYRVIGNVEHYASSCTATWTSLAGTNPVRPVLIKGQIQD